VRDCGADVGGEGDVPAELLDIDVKTFEDDEDEGGGANANVYILDFESDVGGERGVPAELLDIDVKTIEDDEDVRDEGDAPKRVDADV
jgi:hypothetical protein